MIFKDARTLALLAAAGLLGSIPFINHLNSCTQVTAFQAIQATRRPIVTSCKTFLSRNVVPSLFVDDEEANSWKVDLLQHCKKATTRSTNPHKSQHIDSILQRLNSPAPQSFFVLQRAVQRYQQSQLAPVPTTTAAAETSQHKKDECHDLKHMLQITASFVVKRGNKLVISSSSSSYHLDQTEQEQGEGLFWNLFSENQTVDDTKFQEIRIFDAHNNGTSNNNHHPVPSTLQMANQALEIVTQASQDQKLLSRDAIRSLVDQAMDQLSWTLGMDLRGRTSADAAFLFALGGVSGNERLFQWLACISQYELQRVGKRPSFYSKYILQIVEKHAAAGTRGPAVQALYDAAADCLEEKGEHLDVVEMLRTTNNSMTQSLDLLSPRPLLWLWRFSARQKKAKANNNNNNPPPSSANTANNGVDSNMKKTNANRALQFKENHRPLVFDIGCGFGTSLLGLATTSNNEGIHAINDGISFENCNFLGTDLSQLALNFAQGVAIRWGLTDKLHYIWETAEDCLDMIECDYVGNVELIMIQFPTPYRLDTKTATSTSNGNDSREGNSQLPSDAQSGFMVSEELLHKIAKTLSKSGGRLLFQSNCEDVAVTVRQRAVQQHGMKIVEFSHHVESVDDMQQPTLRDLQWAEVGGARAIGTGWSSKALLPPRGVTETEAACQLQGTPIHRFIGIF